MHYMKWSPWMRSILTHNQYTKTTRRSQLLRDNFQLNNLSIPKSQWSKSKFPQDKLNMEWSRSWSIVHFDKQWPVGEP
jgi:hypothetical protein